jgi:hypothetical protein
MENLDRSHRVHTNDLATLAVGGALFAKGTTKTIGFLFAALVRPIVGAVFVSFFVVSLYPILLGSKETIDFEMVSNLVWPICVAGLIAFAAVTVLSNCSDSWGTHRRIGHVANFSSSRHRVSRLCAGCVAPKPVNLKQGRLSQILGMHWLSSGRSGTRSSDHFGDFAYQNKGK